jgi:hypothetical protein
MSTAPIKFWPAFLKGFAKACAIAVMCALAYQAIYAIGWMACVGMQEIFGVYLHGLLKPGTTALAFGHNVQLWYLSVGMFTVFIAIVVVAVVILLAEFGGYESTSKSTSSRDVPFPEYE